MPVKIDLKGWSKYFPNSYITKIKDITQLSDAVLCEVAELNMKIVNIVNESQLSKSKKDQCREAQNKASTLLELLNMNIRSHFGKQ